MNITRSACWLAVAAFLAGCSTSGNSPTPRKDATGDGVSPGADAGDTAPAAPDLQKDVGLDTAPDLSVGKDLARDLGADLASDFPFAAEAAPEAGPEVAVEVGGQGGSEVRAESGSEVIAEVGSDGPRACFWPTSYGMYDAKHFSFSLTTPDGQAQSPPRSLGVDAGGWPINDFEGQIASASANQFTVDSCTTGSCQPSLYRFTLCNTVSGSCSVSDATMRIGVPTGRRVRVVWRLDNDVPGFCQGLFFLGIYDAETGPTKGNVLFVGSGGRQSSSSPSALAELPFSFTTKELFCGEKRDGSILLGDDYAFIFTPKSGPGAPVQLGTGESGVLQVAAPAGGTQTLQVHCVDALQPPATDDYWNYDFWATGAVGTTVDAGGGGG
jgi:hypothetical protein